nr:luc7-like protein 3 [Rhipicephalus microplus]
MGQGIYAKFQQRPAERSFKNQQESLRATRKEAAALVPFSRRLEQDLLSLVCDKKRDDQASGRRRYSSPVRSRRLKERRRSCERRDSEDQQERRRRRRKGSPQRHRADPSSPSPSSSCSSDWSYGKRRRKSRWRSRRSYSPEERVPALRAPPSAAPSARASFRRSARHFTTPPSARTADVTRSASSSPGRRQSKTEKDEKRDHVILVHSLQHVHNALDAKRLQLYPDKNSPSECSEYQSGYDDRRGTSPDHELVRVYKVAHMSQSEFVNPPNSVVLLPGENASCLTFR